MGTYRVPKYDIDIRELVRAFRDFDEFVEDNGGWNYGEIPIIDAFIEFIECGDTVLEPRDN